MRSRHLLDERARALLRAKLRHQHRQEDIGTNVELSPNCLAVPHRGIVSNAAWDHAYRVGPVTVAHQVLGLTRGHGHDGVRTWPHRPEQEPLVPTERSDSEWVGPRGAP